MANLASEVNGAYDWISARMHLNSCTEVSTFGWCYKGTVLNEYNHPHHMFSRESLSEGAPRDWAVVTKHDGLWVKVS